MSEVPLGGKGTFRLIWRSGKVCACTQGLARITPAAMQGTTTGRRRDMVLIEILLISQL